MIKFVDFIDLTPIELEEALSNAGRRSLARSMKRNRFKLARSRKKQSRRRATPDRINKRANRQARSDIKKRFSPKGGATNLAAKKAAERRANMMKGLQATLSKRLRAPKRRADRR